MWPWLKKIVYDEATFEQYARFGIALAATLIPELVNVGAAGTWAGKVITCAALLIKAGDKNPPTAATP